MDEIQKAKDIFLNDVDSDTYEENKALLEEWEENLIYNEAYASWQEHDISKNIASKLHEAYNDFTDILGNDKNLSQEARIELFAKKDAIKFLLNLLETDAKEVVEGIKKDVNKLIDATK